MQLNVYHQVMNPCQPPNQSINHAHLNAPFAGCAKTKKDTSLAFAFAIVPPRMLNRLIYYTVRVCVESLIAKKKKSRVVGKSENFSYQVDPSIQQRCSKIFEYG